MYGHILGREYLDFAINTENKENGSQIYKRNSSTDLFLKMLFSVFFQLISFVFYSLSKQSNSKNTDVVLSLIIIACCLLFIHLHEENVTVKTRGTKSAYLQVQQVWNLLCTLFSGEIDQQFASYEDLIFTKVLNWDHVLKGSTI